MTFLQHLWHLALFLVILLGPVPLCLWIFSRVKDFGDVSSFAQACFVVLLVWCVLQTSLALALGMLGYFSRQFVLASEIIFFLAGCIALRHFRWKILLSMNREETLILGILSSVGLALLWQILSQPVTEHDTLAYHLPSMAKWYQSASLCGGLEQFQTSPIRGYPYGWETLCALFVMPFREDLFVLFPNLVAWFLLGISAYLAGITLGASRVFAATAAALLLSMPISIEHVASLRTDLPLATFFVSCLYLALLFQRTKSPQTAALFLASLGMCLGVRTSGIVYGSLLAVFILAAGIRGFRLSGAIVPGVLSLLLLGGFWYIKNWVEMRNPLGSGVGIFLAGKAIFPGHWGAQRIYQTTLAHLFDPIRLSHWKILLGQMKDRLGIPFFAMILSGTALPCALKATGDRMPKKYILGLVSLLVATGLLYWLTPVSGDNGTHRWQITPWIGQGLRYAFPCLGILAILSGVLMSKAGVWEVIALPVVLASTVSCLAPGDAMYLPVLFIVVHGLSSGQSGKVSVRTTLFVICAVLISFTVVSFLAREKRSSLRYVEYGGVQDYLSTHLEKRETVGYLLSHRSYLFYGKELDRKIIYTPALSGDMTQWMGLLRSLNIRTIAVGPLLEAWKTRRELSWLNDKAGPFIRVFGENPDLEPVLYRLKGS